MSRNEQPTELLVSRGTAKAQLQEQIRKRMQLRQTEVSSYEQLSDFRKMHYNWTVSNIDILLNIFTTDEIANQYASIYRFDSNRAVIPTLSEETAELLQREEALIHYIETVIKTLELIPVSSVPVQASR